LRCEVSTEVNGKTYKAWGTAAFEPEKIQPFVKMPTDFDQFWNNAKTELSKIPMDAVVTLQSDQCTADYNVYHVCLKNINMPEAWRGKSSVYGMVSIPKKPGKYPAILGVPGAGIRSYHGDGRAAKGAIVFNIGIHGIPVNMPDENYSVLANGALSDYWTLHLEDRDKYYYKRVFLGCVRAIDYIFSLPEFDGKNLAVNGGSQGGALSIICAGLDKRITCLAAFYPAMCDMPGYLAKRAGGWPHMFRNWDKEVNPKWLETIAYFDVVNFARRVSQPGWYTWGYDDNVCPPTSMFAAYNSLTGKKVLNFFYETEHWNFPEQWEFSNTWMYQQLGISTEN
jgi:cephalosporin-C deacetylase